MLYSLSVRLYGAALRLASPFHRKARRWTHGRARLWQKLSEAMQAVEKPVVWVHVASLGEFEQARPVIEGLRAQHGDRFFLVVSFFSPSGYEVRKDYPLADFITYLPIDTPANARRWLSIVRPSLVLWVKYEFWWHFLAEVQARQVPLVLFSAIFRQDHLFFKPSAGKFLNILRSFTQIFVQNAESLALLAQHRFENAQIAGDTRFDRVLATVENFEPVPYVAEWRQDSPTLVAGSVWERDLRVLLPAVAKFPTLKVIFAPHEMSEKYFQQIEQALPAQTVRYSQYSPADGDKRALIIDNVGMLARLYYYGHLAYIGGAFKEGLHNILEPAAFGLPVIFGRDYRKFPEAASMIAACGAFSIRQEEELTALFEHLLRDEQARQPAGEAAQNFIKEHRGGAARILQYIAALDLFTM